MNNVPATRMNLLNCRQRLGVAKDGVELLKSKREALIKDFFRIVDSILVTRDEMANQVQRSMALAAMAQAFAGSWEIRAASLAVKRDIPMSMKEVNIWGIRIPEIRFQSLRRTPEARGMLPVDTPPHVLETSEAYEELLENLLRVASEEIRLKRLGEEIRKVSRRINALEQSLIPGLSREIRRIRETLEEREREDLFRLKHIKRRRGEKAVGN